MLARRSLLFLAALCVIGSTATPLIAHDEFRFVGSVVKMDAAKNLVTVKYKEFDGKEDTVDVKILPTTKITRNNKPAPKADVKAGASVVVDALGCDDDFEAVSIRLVAAPR